MTTTSSFGGCIISTSSVAGYKEFRISRRLRLWLPLVGEAWVLEPCLWGDLWGDLLPLIAAF